MHNLTHTEQILTEIRSTIKLEIRTLLKKHTLSYQELELTLKEIESWGYVIQKDDDSLIFVSAPDSLIDSEISFGLKTKQIGKNILAYQSVGSTNASAQKLAEQHSPEGTIVVAEQQTEGKGRFGRHWHSIAQKGIYCSILLRPKFSPEYAPGLSIMTAVALADTFAEVTDAEVQIKWPNDLLLNKKKSAGILTELSAEKNKINHVIVGVGMNINHTADDFPHELSAIATSLRIENKAKLNRIELLQSFLMHFETAYENYKINQLHSMHTKINIYSSLLRKTITLTNGKETINGKVVEINRHGSLVLDSQGKTIIMNSGEVTVVKT